MTWKKAKLKDLGWLRSAGVNKLSEPNQKEVRLLNYMDIYRNQKISNDIDFQIVTAKETEIKNANLEVGDILFTPSSEKPTDIGHAGIIIEDLENTVYSYHLVRFRPDEPKKFNPHFLAYALNSFSSEKHFISRATGTTRYTLSKSDFQSLEFEYPENPAEQTAIATLLSKVDEAIASTQNSIKAAEKLKKALMQNLLTGKLKPDGSWRTEDEFYEDEKFGKVPLGWEVDRFKNKITVKYGKSQKDIVSENGKIPIYGTGGIMEYGTAALCENESILIGRKGTIDKPYYINTPFWAVDTTYYVESFESGNMKFLYYSLQRLNLKSLNEATGVPSLTRRTLNRQMMLFPSQTEQNEITFQIEKFDNVTESKQTKIQTLQRLKKSLMQNLLTGKVRLPEEFVLMVNDKLLMVNDELLMNKDAPN